MARIPCDVFLPDPDATDRLGAELARVAQPGDTLLLTGDLGAGKTHLARAFIQAALSDAGLPMEDVPSPSYTLVQTYDLGQHEIWHADLYRLGGPDDTLELGLDDAMGTAIVVVEWPDRLGDAAPSDALRITLSPAGNDGRTARLESNGRWTGVDLNLGTVDA